MLDSRTKRAHYFARWSGRRRIKIEYKYLLHCLDAFAQSRRQDPLDLGKRSLDCRRGYGQTKFTGSQQTEGKCKRLFLREHQRGQLEARPQSIGTVTSPSSLNRNTQVLQHRDIAAHRPRVDLKTFSNLRPTQLLVRLQQLQDGQNPCCGEIHGDFPFPTNYNKIVSTQNRGLA